MTRWIIININEYIEKFYPQLPPEQIEEIAEHIEKHWDYSNHRRQVNVEVIPQMRPDRLLGDGDKNT